MSYAVCARRVPNVPLINLQVSPELFNKASMMNIAFVLRNIIVCVCVCAYVCVGHIV